METTQVLGLSVEIFAADDFFFWCLVWFFNFHNLRGQMGEKTNPFLLEGADSGS